MLFDKKFIEKFENEFTDQQKQIALIGITSSIEIKTIEDYMNFLSDPKTYFFTKNGRWAGSRIVNCIAKAYYNSNRNIKENPFNNKYLEDIIFVNNEITGSADQNLIDVETDLIEELFLLEYEKYYSGSILPDIELNRKFLKRLQDKEHSSWYFPNTKSFKENSIKRMYVTVDLYLEENELLKDYYNSLKKHNQDLKDDSIKLINEINKTAGNSRKVTLYNCVNPISKDIWQYPLEDIVKHRYNISWVRAFNDPKFYDFLYNALENEEYNPRVNYSELEQVLKTGWQLGKHAELGRKLILTDGFRKKRIVEEINNLKFSCSAFELIYRFYSVFYPPYARENFSYNNISNYKKFFLDVLCGEIESLSDYNEILEEVLDYSAKKFISDGYLDRWSLEKSNLVTRENNDPYNLLNKDDLRDFINQFITITDTKK